MKEVIYRIYEVSEDDVNIILEQQVMCCKDRDHFKEIMRDLYGGDIKFSASRHYKTGQIYCIIISEDCYDSQKYLAVADFICSNCSKNFKELFSQKITCGYYNLDFKIANEIEFEKRKSKIEDMIFCSYKCRDEMKQNIINEFVTLRSDDYIPNEYITTNTFSNIQWGYIYKISKRQSQEFYIGQTSYMPIFRWGQHLLTERFDAKNIEDYIFEVIEVVNDKELLNERERYWISYYHNLEPSKILNIQIPKSEV